MAEVRLTDAIVPTVFNPYVFQKTMELSALFQSGIIAPHKEVSAQAKAGGQLINIPYWNDLGNTESNVGSDDPAVKAVALKITAGQDIAIKFQRNELWSAMDLVTAMAGDDPMKRIGDHVATYWARDMQRTVIATLTGVFADNIANNSSDMVNTIGNDAVGAPSAAELVSASAIIDTAQTMGDAKGDLVAIAMHSVVHANLQKQNLIATVTNSDGKIMFETYLGYRVIVDDGCPAVAGVNRILYTTYLFGKGALAHGEGSPLVPTAVKRDEDTGNGEGQETLFSRKHYVLHPRGIKFVSGALVGNSPTNTELANALNWTRVYERKAIRLVALQTNG